MRLDIGGKQVAKTAEESA